MKEELCSIHFSEVGMGQIKVEKKEDIKRVDRLGRSPDRVDALVYAFVINPDKMRKDRLKEALL